MIPTGTVINNGSWFVISLLGQRIDNSDSDSVVLRNRSEVEVDRTPALTDPYDDGRDRQRIPDAGADWEFMFATKEKQFSQGISSKEWQSSHKRKFKTSEQRHLILMLKLNMA